MDQPTDDDIENLNKELILGILAALATLTADDDDDDDGNGTGWEDVPNGSHVRPLDETNFRETIKDNCCVLVFFHANWCAACAEFKPAYAEFAANAAPCEDCGHAGNGGNGCRCRAVIAAAVDCTRDFTVPMEWAVDKLPTVVMFLDGDRAAEYDGDRTVGDLRRFVRCTLAARGPTTKRAVKNALPAAKGKKKNVTRKDRRFVRNEATSARWKKH